MAMSSDNENPTLPPAWLRDRFRRSWSGVKQITKIIAVEDWCIDHSKSGGSYFPGRILCTFGFNVSRFLLLGKPKWTPARGNSLFLVILLVIQLSPALSIVGARGTLPVILNTPSLWPTS